MNRYSSAFVLAVSCCLAAAAVADDAASRGREILGKNRGAVVTVQLVIKQQTSYQGGSSQAGESKTEATGTVIDPTGLVVMSLSESDPMSIFEAMMDEMPGGFKMETEVRDVKILLEDGTEVPAEIVLRDRDLDMAFVRPKEKPESDFACVDLEKTGEPEILDQVIALNRLGKVAGRVYSASVERVDAIVHKPRTFYVPGSDPTNTGLGSPVFTLEGDFIGVLLLRTIKNIGGASGMMFGGMEDNVIAVILPAEDVISAAEQVPPFEE